MWRGAFKKKVKKEGNGEGPSWLGKIGRTLVERGGEGRVAQLLLAEKRKYKDVW